MYKWKELIEDSEASLEYRKLRALSFARNQTKRAVGGRDIAIYFYTDDGIAHLVGGFTLHHFDEENRDSGLDEHWIQLRTIKGTRVLGLWIVKAGRARFSLAFVFRALLENTDPNSFVYGVLSLPLSFARRNLAMFETEAGYLLPRRPLEVCDWHETARPSSDGKKLIHLYREIGARILGEASGDPADQSVRILLGVGLNEVPPQKKEEIYAKTGP